MNKHTYIFKYIKLNAKGKVLEKTEYWNAYQINKNSYEAKNFAFKIYKAVERVVNK